MKTYIPVNRYGIFFATQELRSFTLPTGLKVFAKKSFTPKEVWDIWINSIYHAQNIAIIGIHIKILNLNEYIGTMDWNDIHYHTEFYR